MIRRKENSGGGGPCSKAKALAAANSGKLDPYHQFHRTLGELEIFDPQPLRKQQHRLQPIAHDPMAGYANGVVRS